MNLLAGAIDPIAFETGALTVYWYGIIIAFAVFVGYFVAQKEAKRQNFPEDTIADLLLISIPLAIIGARLYYVTFRFDHYADNPLHILFIWEGGLAIHGAIFAGVIAAIVFTKRKSLSFWKLADVLAPALLLGQAIGRWGNFINQEVYGGEVSRSFLEQLFLPKRLIEQMFINGAYHQPTFLYESLWSLLGVGVLVWLRRKPFLRTGEIFLGYVIWYSVGRFIIEGIRTDYLLLFDTIRVAQLVSAAAVIFAIVWIFFTRKVERREL
ncbi:prolipoprotein diacylglyceryl transferase [Salisediminibacterium halotolerans]|uniref:Phosphatidylglycerol--prolipoprotein diacylglyceryl transferase n=1 Tax=Salisediminibacterium halotolerans TaxID=517425 RepID=A0A1H9WYX6_9BACI|nr:prolipoprotein diacylglyceryl transferase [Salisediminibacterium haloalkalitolerans]SES39158.1 phosphatidylglycerol:prolipoprotein diacylglycerol transferase [Salisediminibacterium haloalkalitolerans]